MLEYMVGNKPSRETGGLWSLVGGRGAPGGWGGWGIREGGLPEWLTVCGLSNVCQWILENLPRLVALWEYESGRKGVWFPSSSKGAWPQSR